uniref:Uncharacterized protein n=1 Tax=Romanomermis culicivorax TaxID=13658 RepID=A0A915IT73_ROMCU
MNFGAFMSNYNFKHEAEFKFISIVEVIFGNFKYNEVFKLMKNVKIILKILALRAGTTGGNEEQELHSSMPYTFVPEGHELKILESEKNFGTAHPKRWQTRQQKE